MQKSWKFLSRFILLSVISGSCVITRKFDKRFAWILLVLERITVAPLRHKQPAICLRGADVWCYVSYRLHSFWQGNWQKARFGSERRRKTTGIRFYENDWRQSTKSTTGTFGLEACFCNQLASAPPGRRLGPRRLHSAKQTWKNDRAYQHRAPVNFDESTAWTTSSARVPRNMILTSASSNAAQAHGSATNISDHSHTQLRVPATSYCSLRDPSNLSWRRTDIRAAVYHQRGILLSWNRCTSSGGANRRESAYCSHYNKIADLLTTSQAQALFRGFHKWNRTISMPLITNSSCLAQDVPWSEAEWRNMFQKTKEKQSATRDQTGHARPKPAEATYKSIRVWSDWQHHQHAVHGKVPW